MPNCRSYANSQSGLCRYHEQKGVKLAAILDKEQFAPEEEARARLGAARTFEKFSTDRREERERELRRRREEHERKKREWQERQREKISRLERAISGLQQSIRRDSDHLEDLKRKKDNVRPGRNASEIYRNMNKKMEEVANRRWDKQRKLAEMESSLADMKSELSRSFS